MSPPSKVKTTVGHGFVNDIEHAGQQRADPDATQVLERVPSTPGPAEAERVPRWITYEVLDEPAAMRAIQDLVDAGYVRPGAWW